MKGGNMTISINSALLLNYCEVLCERFLTGPITIWCANVCLERSLDSVGGARD